MVLGAALLTLSDAVSKWLTRDFPVGQILCLRTVFVFLPVGAYLWRQRSFAALRVTNWGGQALRGVLFIATAGFMIASVGLLPLADVIAVAFASPIFVAALSVPLLGEQVGWRRWTAVLVGFAGVLVMVRPTGAAFQIAMLLPVATALASGLRDIVTRRIGMTESSISILACSSAIVALAGLGTLPFGWRPVGLAELGLFVLNGTLNGGAHFMMIEAFRRTEAALVAPFKYSGLVWGMLFGFLIFGDLPDHWIIAGSVLVVGSGLYLLHRETRR